MSTAPLIPPGGGQPADDVTLSVIVVSWKVRDMLRDCLRSLLAETSAGVQVIVVDNDSGDGSVEMVRAEFPSVTLLANRDNVGFGKANNQALPLCRGRYVCLLNPDTVVSDRGIDRCLRFLADHPDIGLIGPRLANPDGSLQRWTGGAFPTVGNVASYYLLLDNVLPPAWRPRPLFLAHDAQAPLDVDWISGACMVMRRECFGESFFDERFFMYGEDMELCHRIRRTGWRVVYFPVVTIVHIQGASMRQQSNADVLASALKGPRRFFSMIERNPVRRFVFDLLPVIGFLARWILYSLAAPVSGNPRHRVQAKACRRYLGIALKAMIAPR